jgi:hypothetical protein
MSKGYFSRGNQHYQLPKANSITKVWVTTCRDAGKNAVKSALGDILFVVNPPRIQVEPFSGYFTNAVHEMPPDFCRGDLVGISQFVYPERDRIFSQG